uniref:NADH-ubiquinone oxidoreductase chain 3 n=1 Tax=Staphylinoidea sp. 9 KM-2017 TaxID=2219463 RepID=A0A346RGE0_9COLE|nr:NADH dehydrogenase subunit 3 [Staphylinoidea sp. 9 KM-2017]
MYMIYYMSLIILMLTFLIMSISMLISKKSFMDREKSSPFECGFDPKSSARMPFSIQFYLIAIIFLIFDVEITMLLPFIMSIKLSNLINLLIISFFFILILIIGLYHEWNQGALKWAN